MITRQTKSKSLFELFKERAIVNFGDYFCCILIFSAKLLICCQIFVNLKYIQKLEISYKFEVRLIFTPMYGGRICNVLLTVQIIGGRSRSSRTDTSLAFTQTKWAASTEINLLSFIHVLVRPWWNVQLCLQFRRNSNLQYFFFAFLSRDPRKRVARGGKLWSLDAEYIQVHLVFCYVMEKLLIFYI